MAGGGGARTSFVVVGSGTDACAVVEEGVQADPRLWVDKVDGQLEIESAGRENFVDLMTSGLQTYPEEAIVGKSVPA